MRLLMTIHLLRNACDNHKVKDIYYKPKNSVLGEDSIVHNYREGFLSAVKTIEEGAVYKGSPELVRFFYDHGVSRIKDMVRHARYIYNVAGIDAIGLGTNFDGIDDHLELNGAGDMQKLADALSAAGFTTGEIEKIFWRNAMRVYEVVLGD